MKICLVSRKFDSQSGSAEWIFADKFASMLECKGFNVLRIDQKYLVGNPLAKTLHDFFIVPIKLLYHRATGVKLFHYMNENQALSAPLINLTGGRTVVSFHDFLGLGLPKVKRSYFYFMYWVASKSKKIICNSSLTQKELESLFGKKKDIRVIPCVHTSFKKKSNKRRKIIGFIGALSERKRPGLLVELGKKKKDYIIEIWGKGKLYEPLMKKVKIDKITNVRLNGFAPEENLEDIYNSFRFYFFPSEQEGLGLPVIEALSCGVPVFSLSDAKVPEEVRAGTIVVKDVEELAHKVRECEAKYQKLSDNAIKYSKNFNINVNLKRFIDAYGKN